MGSLRSSAPDHDLGHLAAEYLAEFGSTHLVPAAAAVDGRRAAAQLQASVDEAIAGGQWGVARARLHELFAAAPSVLSARFVSGRLRQLPRLATATRCRLAVARSFTVEPVLPLLEAAALLHGVELDVHVGDFNTHAQDLLDPGSALYAHSPDVVLLAVAARDVAPDLWQGFAGRSEGEVSQAVERVVAGYRGWVAAFRARSRAHLVVQGLELPADPDLGLLDTRLAMGQAHALQEVNRRLAGLAREWPDVHLLDYDGLVARHGRARWTDQRRWLTARMPLANDSLWPLAAEYLRWLLPLAGRTAKVLVVDLDNTLWGGVLGEDGPDGLRLDGEYPGAAFAALQRAVLAVQARGVLLAVASKNDHDEALRVIAGHPGMLLRPGHFAAFRIGWGDKARSLREIAAELNVGVDALAFLDDSPAERERVRQELPEVTVVDLPADPMGYAAALRTCPVLERTSLSAEDRARGRHYAEQRRRAELEQSVASVEDYLRSLDMEMELGEAVPAAIPRIAQLTQKTNQFNLTTRRFTEAEITGLAAGPATRVYQVGVADRFGDSGLVGVAVTRDEGDACEIEALLLSCRVIGRTVETAMLAGLAGAARDRGLRRLRGWFRPTPKNAPASSFYPAHGFTAVEEREDGTLWELDLRAARIERPEWIRPRHTSPEGADAA